MKVTLEVNRVADMAGGHAAIRNSDSLKLVNPHKMSAVTQALKSGDVWVQVGEAARPLVQAVIDAQRGER